MSIITRQIVAAPQRLQKTRALFGLHFPLQVEPMVFTLADRLSEDYRGGYWDFFTLSNGGFYMAPCSDQPFRVTCDNGYVGELSADALGITVCLYAYSQLSFSQKPVLSEMCTRHFHWLRDYMLDHPEAGAILGAID